MSKIKGSNRNSNDNNNNNNSSSNNNNSNHNNARNRQQHNDEPERTKRDYQVANYLRDKLPDKEAMFIGIRRVNYFIGSKAVDLLMEADKKFEFQSRRDAVMFLNSLLLKNFYHRARKIVKMDGEKKKFKLDMHDIQVFEDSNQPYVWLYEPTSIKAWLLCLGVIGAVIAICLFPLWPPIIRTWVYYLCIVSLGLLSSILVLAVLRHVVFMGIYMITLGHIRFWLLPNLTEDVGFFESFWPIYTLERADTSVGAGDGGVDAGGGSSEAGGHSHQD